jgi:hypothetical protein
MKMDYRTNEFKGLRFYLLTTINQLYILHRVFKKNLIPKKVFIMRKKTQKLAKLCVLTYICISAQGFALDRDPVAAAELEKVYHEYCSRACDINEHIPVLKTLALECSSAIEIGIRSMVSTWGVLQGLAENNVEFPSYIGIDILQPPSNTIELAKRLSAGNNIDYTFIQANDMEIDIPDTDLLFIDSLHTYCHLSYELEKFNSNVKKYIVMHDTSYPWGSNDDIEYTGDYSEYPDSIDKTKRGLWLAVEDFLAKHPEWTIHKRLFNNYGFTILKRVADNRPKNPDRKKR